MPFPPPPPPHGITEVVSTTGEIGVTTPTTAPDLSIASTPASALVAGTGVTLVTTAGKAKINASGGTGTVTDVTSTDVTLLTVTTPTTTPKLTVVKAPTVVSAPASALVAGTGVTLVTTAGKAKVSASSGPLSAETSLTGVALIDGLQTILSLTVPNDGKVHVILAAAALKTVTVGLAGGKIQWSWTGPSGTGAVIPTTTGTTGPHVTSIVFSTQNITLKPSSVIALKQTTAMTSGSAKVYAKLVIL